MTGWSVPLVAALTSVRGGQSPPPAQRETEANQTETEEQNGRGLRQDLSLGADRQIVYAEVPIGSHRAIEPPKL